MRMYATCFTAAVVMMLPSYAYGATWTSQGIFEHGESTSNELLGVSCSASTTCTGVGGYTNKAGEKLPLALRWNGTEWSFQTPVNPAGETNTVLFGVSCVSSTECYAVGGTQSGATTQVTLIELWNGTTWSVQKSPNPTGAIASVLHGISCTSATACISAGSYVSSSGITETLTESWGGKEWSIKKSPNPKGALGSELAAASCTSSTACTAAGRYANSELHIVTLAERWNGTEWTIQETPNPAGETDTVFLGVSCVSSTECYAAGGAQHGENTQITLSELWNGKEWTIQKTPNPTGSKASVLQGISCTSSTACEAVGDYVPTSGTNVTLAESWNGKEWTIQETPSLTGTFNALFGVSCKAETKCEAVGAVVNIVGKKLGLAEGYS
jgi:hypothetical protein